MRAQRRALFLFPSDRMGGAERVTYTLAKEALRSEHIDEVDCFVLCWDRTGTLDSLENEDGVSIHYAFAPNHMRGLAAMMWFLRSKTYDLVFSSHLHINAICSLLRKTGLLKTERLVARESTAIFEREFGLRGGLIRCMYALYGSQDLIVCQTEGMKLSLLAHCSEKLRPLIRTIPNPLDLDRIRLGLVSPEIASRMPTLEGKRAIVWCGRLIAVKAPERALQTLRTLHQRGYSNTHLLMVGDGPLRASLDEVIQRDGLSGAVTMLGYVENPAAIMAHAELGVLTSDTEGFPNVVLEMLASGVRAVATTDCAEGLAKLPGIRVAQDKTPESLADILELLLCLDEADPLIEESLRSRNPARYYSRISGDDVCMDRLSSNAERDDK
ncbi:glycosyltransferase [Sphingopyxis fribergensis]